MPLKGAGRSAPPVRVTALHKAFGRQPVLKGVSVSLRPGALNVIVGRSGSGKSTLLRCLNGLETPDSGEIEIAGLQRSFPDDAHDRAIAHDVRLRVGMVFQHFELFPHLNVFDNLCLAPGVVQGRDSQVEATALLAKVGLSGHHLHYPRQLSGGQQQRAAIARALVMQPQVLLYDEPTSALDPHLANEVLEVMLALKKDGLTQVLVTHELAFARRYGDHVAFLEDGTLVEEGPPTRVFGKPSDPRTRAFLRATRA